METPLTTAIENRFRTKKVTLSDTTNGVLIDPTIFGYTANFYKMKWCIIADASNPTHLSIKSLTSTDDFVAISSSMLDNIMVFDNKFTNGFYLKSQNNTDTVGIIAYVVDQSSY